MGPPVFVRGFAGRVQLARKVVYDCDVFERGRHGDLVADVASDDFHAFAGKLRGLRRRPNQRAYPNPAEEQAANKGSPEEAGRPRDQDRATRKTLDVDCGVHLPTVASWRGRSRFPKNETARECPTSRATFITVGPWVSMLVYAALASGQ